MRFLGSLDIADLLAFIGVFGQVASLTLRGSFPAAGKWLAQDLAGDQVEDISAAVQPVASGLRIDGSVLRRIGLSAATTGDLSEPGLLLQCFGT